MECLSNGVLEYWNNGMMLKEAIMFGIGMPELVIILVIIMIIFGANKLPQMGAGLAKGIRNFKKGIDGKEEIDATPKKNEDVK
jgi:sec-independent protein translocase protein TatA